MSVGAIIGIMFIVVSVILLGLEWLSRDASAGTGGEQARRQQATRRRPPR